jgi:TM2 domain-containing membrane protein YozV
MVDDELFMQQVQDLLSRYPLQPVDGDLSELTGYVDGRFVRVTIPAIFPDQGPEITIDGVRAIYSYFSGMSLAFCLETAVKSSFSATSPYTQDIPSGGNSPEDQFMNEVQQILLQHPEFQPVGGDLRHLQGMIQNASGSTTIDIVIPDTYPVDPAHIISTRDFGYGRSFPHTNIAATIFDALAILDRKSMEFQVYSSGAYGTPQHSPVSQSPQESHHTGTWQRKRTEDSEVQESVSFETQRSGSPSRTEPVRISSNSGTDTDSRIPISRNHKDAGTAAFCSFFIPGLGQVYNGQIEKGAGFYGGMLFGYIIGWMAGFYFFFLIPAFWIYGMYDAYSTANRMNSGEIPYQESDTSRMVIYAIGIIVFGIIFNLVLCPMIFGSLFAATNVAGSTVNKGNVNTIAQNDPYIYISAIRYRNAPKEWFDRSGNIEFTFKENSKGNIKFGECKSIKYFIGNPSESDDAGRSKEFSGIVNGPFKGDQQFTIDLDDPYAPHQAIVEIWGYDSYGGQGNEKLILNRREDYNTYGNPKSYNMIS